jgi:hypothetical protein
MVSLPNPIQIGAVFDFPWRASFDWIRDDPMAHCVTRLECRCMLRAR